MENHMNATISIQNAEPALINAIRAVIKTALPNVKYKISKQDDNESQSQSHYPPEVVKKIIQIADQTEADYLAGKIKAYESSADFRKAIENGEI